ncbi:MAG TPA: alanine racemase [Candidatus Paceibacterota bacterium]|nr:alanine racemase [Candidatus Paceibacterota bacterium]
MKNLGKTWVEVSKKNILHNIGEIRGLLGGAKFMAVVKSNAYGHGLLEISKICAESKKVDWLGVDSVEEALAIRKAKIKLPILVLGYIPFEELKKAIENNISFVAYNDELLSHLAKMKTAKKIKIHLKIETGISRQGLAGEELISFAKKALKNKNIFIEGAYTHFANVDDTTDFTYAKKQLDAYEKNIAELEKIVHIPVKHTASSAATINYPETHFDMVRTGISLYGLWSSKETKLSSKERKIKIDLRPALSWKTLLVQVKKVESGTPIGYGLTEKVRRDSTIGILPIGYWDGYDRGLSNIGEVLVRGERAKVLGRICMNMTIVDLTDVKGARLFDEVVLLGKQGNEEITADEIAGKLGTINYEVVTRINPMISRIIDGGK